MISPPTSVLKYQYCMGWLKHIETLEWPWILVPQNRLHVLNIPRQLHYCVSSVQVLNWSAGWEAHCLVKVGCHYWIVASMTTCIKYSLLGQSKLIHSELLACLLPDHLFYHSNSLPRKIMIIRFRDPSIEGVGRRFEVISQRLWSRADFPKEIEKFRLQ